MVSHSWLDVRKGDGGVIQTGTVCNRGGWGSKHCEEMRNSVINGRPLVRNNRSGNS